MPRCQPGTTFPAPDHTAELTRLRARLHSPDLSPLEAAAMLAALELLRGHEQGTFDLCENRYCISLLTLCLGTPFEVVHDEDPDECPCCCHDGSGRRARTGRASDE